MQNVDIIADVNAAIGHLSQQSFIADRIGIIGFCMGGHVAYMMASRNQDIRAAVPRYDGGVFDADGPGPTPFETTADINCPVLILDGEKDEHPSPEQVGQIAAELERLGKVHEVHIFPEVGHGFMSPNRPRSALKSSRTRGPGSSIGSVSTSRLKPWRPRGRGSSVAGERYGSPAEGG